MEVGALDHPKQPFIASRITSSRFLITPLVNNVDRLFGKEYLKNGLFIVVSGVSIQSFDVDFNVS